jgi:acyl-CoA reductase-like NAD-dependent aldehyde dehydrogenase
MTTTMASEPTTYRWSSTQEAERFAVEDPATGDVIAVVQGGGTADVKALLKTPSPANPKAHRT